MMKIEGIDKLTDSIMSCETHEQLNTIQDFICRLHFEKSRLSFTVFLCMDREIMKKCVELNKIELTPDEMEGN